MGDGTEPFAIYRYSTIDNRFTKIDITNETMWINLTNNYGTVDKNILYRQVLKPYIINESGNIGVTLNMASTISDMSNSRVVGLANIGVLFNYASQNIKDVLDIKEYILDEQEYKKVKNGNHIEIISNEEILLLLYEKV